MGLIFKNGIPYGGVGETASETNHVELTYAEFQALSEDEQNNGTVYFITDLSSDGIVTNYVAGTGIEIDENKEISVSDVRKNYIDNSDFSINQTGATEYTEAGYTVDRWYIDGGTVTIADKGVVFTNPATEGLVRLRQDIRYPFEYFAGKTLTLSTKINGEVYYSSATIPAEKPTTGSGESGDTTAVQYITYGNSSYGINLNYSITGNYFVPYIALVYGQEINVEWMKLEIGTKTTPYIEPDYKTELLKVNSMNDKGEILKLSADNVPYDNSESTLTSTTVQDAVDEVKLTTDELSSDLSALSTTVSSINTALSKKSPIVTRNTVKYTAGVTLRTAGETSVVTIPTTLEGYTAIGVIGATPNNDHCSIDCCYVDQTTARDVKLRVRNHVDVSVNLTNIVVFVLYIKNE